MISVDFQTAPNVLENETTDGKTNTMQNRNDPPEWNKK